MLFLNKISMKKVFLVFLWRNKTSLWIKPRNISMVVENGGNRYFCRMLLQIAIYSIKALKYQGFLIKKTDIFCSLGLVLLG